MPIVVAVLGVIIVIMGVVFFTVSPKEEVGTVQPEINRPEMEVVTEEETPARTTLEIDVTLTVEGGIVTDANVVYDNGEGFSNPNQERFDGAYKAEVIGKPLNDISLSRVGGASLTSNAFNEALEIIRTQQS